MKVSFKSLGVICFTLAGHLALACPFLETSGGYAEVAVPCNSQGQPDFSKQPFVNQADSSGGECRTVPANGLCYAVKGSELVLSDKAGQIQQRLGLLTEQPSCYRTDNEDEFSGTWVPIRFYDLK
jgi:hypothetical protein